MPKRYKSLARAARRGHITVTFNNLTKTLEFWRVKGKKRIFIDLYSCA